MKTPSYIVRSRSERRVTQQLKPLGLAGFILAVVLSMAGALGGIYGVYRYAQITRDLPAPETLPALLHPTKGSLLQPTEIYDREGQISLWQFSNPSVPTRRYAAITDGESFFYSEMPETLILASLAALDPVYLERTENFLIGALNRGEDPIPETLVEDLLLWQEENHPYHEIRVKLLADQITARYGREKVLEWYLNSAFYGHGLYGAAQAAAFYFGKEPVDLSLAESTMLAAVANYPALNPLDAPRAARDNQAVILQKMTAAGFITENEAANAARKQLILSDPEAEREALQPPYVDLILREASQTVPQERLLRGGFVLISTLDSGLQWELDCTLEYFAQRISGAEPQLDQDCQAARLLPQHEGLEVTESSSLELNLAVLDPVKGDVRALAGRNTSRQPLTLDEPRLPGSLVTPFIYINAFTQGFEPASLVWDIPLEDSELTAGDLHPRCKQDCQYLGPVNIRTALVNDLLSPAKQFLESQGGNQLRATLELFGFSLQSGVCQNCNIFPESSAVEMLDLLQGYGVFINQGYLKGRPVPENNLELDPTILARIEDVSGTEYPLAIALEEKKVISEQLAYLVNHVLSDPEAWQEPQAREFFQLGRPSGVKLGYVPDTGTGWTIGSTPDYMIGSWAGYGALDTTGDQSAQQISALMWRAITQYISREYPSQVQEMPPGMITLDVCYPSGDLPTESCPRIVREIFIEGYQPLVQDTLYQPYQVNRETGRLASVFTPAERIVDRVYLNVPPRAESWADTAGIEIPPASYDLGNPDPDETGLSFIAPKNLNFVRGRVWITGSIPEDNFQSARLQYGPGLNPRSWLQIGEDINSPVESSFLGIWDTSGLDEGIYALQLVLIKDNQEIEKASLLVSVDNTPPEMILMTDLSGGQVSYRPGRELLLEVDFPNSSEIDQVNFTLDGELLASRRVDPFIIPWEMTLGDHLLEITAVDQAGNRAELQVDFEVVRDN